MECKYAAPHLKERETWGFFSASKVETGWRQTAKAQQDFADENAFYFLSDRVRPQLSTFNIPGKTFHNQIVENNE